MGSPLATVAALAVSSPELTDEQLDEVWTRSLFPSIVSILPSSSAAAAMLTALIFLAAVSILGGTIATALRRGSGTSEAEVRELRDRLLRLEQSMESMTSDMERVAESQRFMTALLEDRARGQAAPRPLPPVPGDESAQG